MLTDASLPAHVTSGLRALAAMLAPPNFGVGSQQRVKPVAPASVSLTDFNSGSDSEEIPYTGERPSTQPKRGRRNMPPSQLRRMSTSTWSTTTSATGMPMLEPEPSRKRSTNFRSSPGMLSPSTGLPSPLPSGPKIGAVKGRSFSTTALPVGTLIQLQERRERRTICSLHPSGSSSIRTDSFDETNLDHRLDKGQYGTKVSDDTSGNSKSKEEPAQSVAQVSSRTFRLGGHSRLNLTSDYDSSNDSPNSSDATVDEHGHLDSMATSNRMGRKSLSSTICRIEEEPPTVICSTGMPRCILCGHTLEMGIQGQVAHPVEAKWPNIPPPDVLPTLLDEHGRHMVDSITYDLNELASDPLLSMINEWDHNSMHAADVLHAVYHLTSQPVPGFAQIPANSSESPLQKTSIGPLPQSYLRHISNCEDSYGIMGANFPALELLALYTAAAMHDYDHPGRTNAFLVSTFAPQAAAWSLFLSRPEYNWLRNLDKSEFKRFRFLVIEFILATDLKRHFEIVAEFNAKVNGEESPGIDWFSETDRLLVQQMCIKLADINGPCKNHDIHVQWTHRIAEEFYEQGDDEARLGFPVSPFMDRKNPQLAKLQESFINHLVAPLCNAYAEAGLLPGHWEYQETQEPEPDMTEPTSLGDKVTSLETTTSKSSRTHSQRKVVCLHTKHLEENYDVWVKILKEEKQGQQMYCSSSSSEEDESTTPVFNQVPLEEIAEESQNSSEGSGSSGQGLN
ncbi:cGMP-inhibited 3',5'-cyclic phosphodiesterase A [Halotydeus destructor]|nr:cGMP-inhibited 3',5'-cyclic phosphodiesterase A [Halotydeus destructor]